MRKYFTRNRIVLLSAILLVAFLSLVILRKSFSNRVDNIEVSAYSSVSSDRKNMWNKMKVSSAVISHRTTGKKIDSGRTSDMNGVDGSPDDDYIKTGDYLIYTVELNINPNTSEEGVFDNTEFYGGVIKFRATLPEYTDKEYLVWQKEGWMSEYILSDDRRMISGCYIAPSDVNLMGSIQELSFTLRANWFTNEMMDDIEFEFWMEGNKPDNETGHISNIESKIVNSRSSLKITAKDPNMVFKVIDGRVKRIGYRNGVLGQYFNFGIQYSYSMYDRIGLRHYDFDNLSTRLKLSLYSRDLTLNNGWSLVNTGSSIYSNMIGRAEIVASNRNCDFNDSAWPYRDSNYLYDLCGFKFSSHGYEVANRTFIYDSGNVSSSVSGGIVTVTNSNISSSHMEYELYSGKPLYTSNYVRKESLGQYTTGYSASGTYLMDSIEIFVPYDLSMGNNIDYKIVLETVDISGYDKASRNTITTSKSNSIELIYSEQNKNNLSGNISLAESSSSYVNDHYIYYGAKKNIISTFSASIDGFFGEERLINFDSSFMEVLDEITIYDQHDLDLNFYYGVYRNNPIKGLTSLEEINSKDIGDFYWYSSYSNAYNCSDLKARGEVNAIENCSVTSIHVKDLNYTGKDIAPTIYFSVKTRSDLYNDYVDGKKYYGNIRQKILLYTDSSRTRSSARTYFYDNNEDSFVPAVFDDYMNVVTHSSPLGSGVSLIAALDYPSSSGYTYDSNGLYAKDFNVIDGMFYLAVSSSLTSAGSIDVRDDMSVIVEVPDSLTLKDSTANIVPSEKYNYSGNNYYIWNFKNCKVGGNVPSTCDGYDVEQIKFGFEMSPTIENNSRFTIALKGYTGLGERTMLNSVGVKDFHLKGSYSTYEVSIANLSGTYARNTKSSDVVSVNEKFTITSNVYNNSSNDLSDVKTVQVLPYNNDEYGSKYNGSYNIRVKSLKNGLKLYYSNLGVSESGVEEDADGKLSVANVSLSSDSRWIQVGVGDIIPSSAKLIASYTPSISASDFGEYAYDIVPSGNKTGDIYAIKTFSSSSTLSSSLSTNVVSVKVYDKKITGVVFLDKNKNNIYDAGDSLLKNQVVELYTEDNTLVRSVTTDSTGRYVFEGLERRNYYIRHRNTGSYLYINKNAGNENVSSVVDASGRSDLITRLQVINLDADTVVDNINVGLSLKQGMIVVNHYINGTTTKLADSQSFVLDYTERYTTSPSSNIPNNYELVGMPSNASGIVDGNITVNYYYRLKMATLTVNHYINGTTTKLADSEVRTLNYTDTYTTSPSSNVSSNYELVEMPSNASGVINGDVVVNYYYRLKEAVLTVKFLDKDTNSPIHADDSRLVYYGEVYEALPVSDIPANYEFFSKTSNYTGIVSSDTIQVIYYYQKKDSSLETSISLSGNDKITKVNEIVSYKIQYDVEAKSYIGDGVIKIVSNLPYKIDLEKSNIGTGIYDENNMTITWTENWNDIDSFSGKGTKSIKNEFSLVYKDIDPKSRIMNISAQGTITLDNNTRSVQDRYSTNINVKGKIIVHHYYKGTNKVDDDVIASDLVGELYECVSITKAGFKLIKEPANKVIEFIDGTIEVVFEYEKLVYSIKTVVLNDGGSISGDEDVEYGGSSTDGLIVIKPQNGYVVSKIIVDGEIIDSGFCQNGCVLDKFTNVTSDKKIEVQFEMGISNPDTSISMKVISIITLIAAFIIFRFILIKYRPRFVKI